MNQIHIFLNISTHCFRHKSQKSSSSDRRKFSPMPFVETFSFSLFFIVVIGLSMGYALIMKAYVIFLESIWQKDFLFPLKFSKVFKNINCFKKIHVSYSRKLCFVYLTVKGHVHMHQKYLFVFIFYCPLVGIDSIHCVINLKLFF